MSLKGQFQLSESEWEWMSSQFVMTYPAKRPKTALPFAFTEHGVTMLANVLKSKKARQTSISSFIHFARDNNISTFTLPKPYAMYNLLLAVFMFVLLSISLKSSAQDYLITFAGTGASTTISTVEVENLATGKTITLNGGDILHLTSVVGISPPEKFNSSAMNIYPNPMMDNSILALYPQESGDAAITVYEMTGKTVAQIHTYLENGRQEFRLSGLQNGLYLINARGNSFQYSGKILSSGQSDRNPGIEKISNTSESKIEKISKKEYSETHGTIDMYYNEGDRLKFKAISGIYSTVKTDIPTEDKTLSFSFISCTDADNNNYSVVEIGSQIWMAENLKTTKYNDGLDIPLVTDGSAWVDLSTPGFCWYNNDSATYNSTYGALYNWYSVKTGKLCPTGWHGATDTEWTVLTDFLGGWTIAGGKLKEAGLAHWLAPNEGATNETGFTALPGGDRSNPLYFTNIKGSGYWWCTPEVYDQRAMCRDMSRHDSNAHRTDDYYRQTGFSVRCLRDLPNISTLSATEITTTSAVSGGDITNNYGYPVTARGVCWSTHENPTIADGVVTNSNELDSFTCLITGLTINTKYYLRAYATNSLGMSYGDQIIIKTMTGQISDIDNNNYYTVTIGTQIWMAENLKTTKYNDGTPIPLVSDSAEWVSLESPGYCWYNYDANDNNDLYGVLYNWYTVNTDKLCPTGWHVPSDAEWIILTDYLGGDEIAGSKLKEAGLAHWIYPNTGATNETGFTALPGYDRSIDGNFYGNGSDGHWWSSEEFDTNFAWYRAMVSNTDIVYRFYDNKKYGFSARCLQDE